MLFLMYFLKKQSKADADMIEFLLPPPKPPQMQALSAAAKWARAGGRRQSGAGGRAQAVGQRQSSAGSQAQAVGRRHSGNYLHSFSAGSESFSDTFHAIFSICKNIKIFKKLLTFSYKYDKVISVTITIIV